MFIGVLMPPIVGRLFAWFMRGATIGAAIGADAGRGGGGRLAGLLRSGPRASGTYLLGSVLLLATWGSLRTVRQTRAARRD